jgi:hypothetical protein
VGEPFAQRGGEHRILVTTRLSLMELLKVLGDVALVLVGAGIGVWLPGALLLRPLALGGGLRSAPCRLVLGYVCGYAGFTVVADWLTRLGGTSRLTLLIGPPLLVGLLGLLCKKPRPDHAMPAAPVLSLSWPQLGACVLFAAVVLAQVLPIRAGDDLYWGYPYLDYTERVAVTHAVARSGSPPLNPSYAPTGDRPLFYYYGFYLFPGALVRYASVGAVTPS